MPALSCEIDPPRVHFEPASAEGDLLVAADLRMDNREEWLAALPDVPRDASDRRLLAEGWRRWGEGCFRRLRGDFAVVLYDRARGVLVAAADPFKTRLLHYHHDGRRTRIATHARTLLAAGVPRRLDRRRLALLSRPGGGGDDGSTFFEGIRSVPGGCYLRVDEHGLRLHRYFHAEELGRQPGRDWLEDCRDAFETAVRARLHGDRPVGLLLSGGLDSSAIQAVARRHLERPLRAVQSVSPDGMGDERDALLRMAPGLDLRLVTCEGRGPFDGLGSALWAAEHPALSSRHYVYSALFEALGEGTVVLDGCFGELGPSYGHEGCVADAVLRGRWRYAAREIGALARTVGLPRAVYREVVRPFLPPRTAPSWFPFREEFLRSALGEEEPAARTWPDRRALMRRRIAAFSGAAIAAARYPGFEIRYPYLDLRLLDLCVAAPAEAHLRDGVRRRLIRSMMEGLLPDDLRLHPRKRPFAPGYDLQYEAQRSHAVRFLERLPEHVAEVVDVERVLEAARHPASGPTDPRALHLVPLGVNLAVFLLNFERYGGAHGRDWLQPIPEA